MAHRKADQTDQSADFLQAYNSATNLLLAWLGTYSVGVPAFLFTNQAALTKLVSQQKTARVAVIFGLAIASQVLITLLNKYIE